MAAVQALAKRHNLLVIEDAAHAHGASYRGRPAGSLGDLGSFSFQSSKNLTAGEGGILITNEDQLAEVCRSMHNCGRVPGGLWYEHHVLCGNYRLGEFQGAVLNCQLDRLTRQTIVRDRNGTYLASRLGSIPGLHPQKRTADCTRHSYHLFMLRLDPEQFGAPRSAVLRALQAEGIPCSGGYGFSLPDQPLFRNRAFGPYVPQVLGQLHYDRQRCPNSDRICHEQAIWIEHHCLLGPRSDMDDIARAFERVYEQRDALGTWWRKESGCQLKPRRPQGRRAGPEPARRGRG
jgi:dTDP-4-amino-4,6-dideoxygalactose transaminase